MLLKLQSWNAADFSTLSPQCRYPKDPTRIATHGCFLRAMVRTSCHVIIYIIHLFLGKRHSPVKAVCPCCFLKMPSDYSANQETPAHTTSATSTLNITIATPTSLHLLMSLFTYWTKRHVRIRQRRYKVLACYLFVAFNPMVYSCLQPWIRAKLFHFVFYTY